MKSKIRSVFEHYDQWLSLDGLLTETTLESRVDRAVKLEDAGEVDITKAERVSLLNQKGQVVLLKLD